MSASGLVMAGIDVGGIKKGFHAVVLRNGTFEKTSSTEPADVVNWCLDREAHTVAVDAPCGWSLSSSSRLAERELARKKIYAFATPTRARALSHKKGFYGWVFNGERLYHQLAPYYPLFDGGLREGRICFETLPHAIVCALAGKVVPANPKNSRRRKILRERGFDDDSLPNIDFIDAALCAVAAEEFCADRTMAFGNCDEGVIVVPKLDVSRA